jgi:hypothetical protein
MLLIYYIPIIYIKQNKAIAKTAQVNQARRYKEIGDTYIPPTNSRLQQSSSPPPQPSQSQYNRIKYLFKTPDVQAFIQACNAM